MDQDHKEKPVLFCSLFLAWRERLWPLPFIFIFLFFEKKQSFELAFGAHHIAALLGTEAEGCPQRFRHDWGEVDTTLLPLPRPHAPQGFSSVTKAEGHLSCWSWRGGQLFAP